MVDVGQDMAQRILKENEPYRGIAAAGDNSAWIENGVAQVIGDNTSGQCDTSHWPQVQMIRLGDQHAVGLTLDGEIVYAGSDDQHQCALDTGGAAVRSVGAGPYASYAVLEDGRVCACGDAIATPGELAQERDVLALAASATHVALLRADGTVGAYGSNAYGECDVKQWRDIVLVDCGYGFTVALDRTGRVYVAGDASRATQDGMTGAKGIAAGVNNCYVIDKSGNVTASGFNGGGQLDAGEWKKAVVIAGGYMHAIGLDARGERLTAGSNAKNQLGG